MLRSTQELVRSTISGSDGDIGRVDALYFDDAQWTVHYLVVDARSWLAGRRVLISPASVRRSEWDRRRLPVALTRAQVRASPEVDTRRPISRRLEAAFSEYYGIPLPVRRPAAVGAHAEGGAEEDPRLHSTEEILGRQVRATDGPVGHVADLLVEDLTWRIRYLDIDLRDRRPGSRVLIAPEWIDDVGWPDSAVSVTLPGETIRSAPPHDPSRPVDREYEQHLYAHHGRPGYWQERSAA
jgi:hypothetical protein